MFYLKGRNMRELVVLNNCRSDAREDIVLIVGDFPREYEKPVVTHLLDRDISARFVRCPKVETLTSVVAKAIDEASRNRVPMAEAKNFYSKVFAEKVGEDLASIAAIVISGAIEEEFEVVFRRWSLFGDYEYPLFIVHSAPFWIDER